MMFHLLTLDSMQHRYGPGTLAATATMAHLDAQVATIVQAVEQAGLAARTTFVIVSDHGFKTVRRQIMPNAAFLKAGLLEVTEGKVTSARVSPDVGRRNGARLSDGAGCRRAAACACEGGSHRDRGNRRDHRARRLRVIRAAVPGRKRSDGRVPVVRQRRLSLSTAAAGEVVADASEGGLGAHGYLSSDPELQGLFIASGRGDQGRHDARLDEHHRYRAHDGATAWPRIEGRRRAGAHRDLTEQ